MESNFQQITDFQPQAFGSEKERLEKKDALFVGVAGGTISARSLIALWLDHFAKNNFDENFILQYGEDFWPWMITIGWNHLEEIDTDHLPLFISETYISGVALQMDIQAAYIGLLTNRDMIARHQLHEAVRGKILHQSIPLTRGLRVESTLTSQDLLKYADLPEEAKADDVSRYEKLAEIEDILFGDMLVADSSELNTYIVDQVRGLLDFVSLFKKDIVAEEIVNIYLEYMKKNAEAPMDENTKVLLGAKIFKEISQQNDKVSPDVAAVTPPPTTISEKETNKNEHLEVLFEQLKETYGDSISRDKIEALLNVLHQEASARGDERIRDFVQFDETTGSFQWNTDILHSS